MFRKTPSPQGDLFKNISHHLPESKQKILNSPSSWHTIFYNEVLSQIDESLFSVLYTTNQGRPNASVRHLLGMMILKEGRGWSDEQLFEESRFNLQVMYALGMFNIDDVAPAMSTYYDFRSRLHKYQSQTGEDLLHKCFQSITSTQIKTHKVLGNQVRLDSKLLNSNIALQNRLELVLSSVLRFMKGVELEDSLVNVLTPSQHNLLLSIKGKTPSNISYSKGKSEQESLLVELGYLISSLLSHYLATTPNYSLLAKLYRQQYEVEGKQPNLISLDSNKSDEDSGEDQEGQSPLNEEETERQVSLKASDAVESGSLQSVHDPDAAYRSKGQGLTKKKVSGYHINITETCDEDASLNLIIDVKVSKANVGEDAFLIPSLEDSEKVLQQGQDKVDKVIQQATTDGGYDSIVNRIYMSEPERPQWNMTKFKGPKRSFEFYYDHDGQLQAKEIKTGKIFTAELNKKEKYRIKIATGQYRYFEQEKIAQFILSQQLEAQLKEEDKNLRANVESTIHACFHRLLKRDKMKYRGILRCNSYAISRVLWVNFRRIEQKIALFDFLICFFSIGWVREHLRIEPLFFRIR